VKPLKLTEELILVRHERTRGGRRVPRYTSSSGRFEVYWSERSGARSTYTVADTHARRHVRVETIREAAEVIGVEWLDGTEPLKIRRARLVITAS
jgi:hypothetical protein